MATTDDQVAIQRHLDALQTTPGLQQTFHLNKTVNRAIIRIFRFLCEDQEWLDRVPEADGSNLADSTVWMDTYSWFREWLSMCHYRNVHRGQLAASFNDATALAMLEWRTHYLGLIEAETKRSPDMQPFRRLYDQHAAVLARGEAPRLVSAMEADCNILALLICAETSVEDYLRGTHVEDVLLEKRFDRDQLDDGSGDDPLYEIRRIHDFEREGWWIRQLRQHGFRRPWQQLHLVLDDGIGQGYAQAISNAAALFRNPRIQRALDVQPIALSAIRDKSCAVMCGKHDDDDAGTSADFGAGDIAMLQFCGQHWIHTTCAFRTWDALGQNNFSFPCPMCRGDAGRLNTKLQLDTEEDNYNAGFDPEVEQANAFGMIQATLFEDFTLLERQHEFDPPVRAKALREQDRLLKEADEQDRYYDGIIANWHTNPQNQNLRMPVHPRRREIHFQSNFLLYDFDDDDDPPNYEEAHYQERALDMISDGVRPDELPEHLQTAWRQWMDHAGFEEMIRTAEEIADDMGPEILNDLLDQRRRLSDIPEEDEEEEEDDGDGAQNGGGDGNQPEPEDEDMPDAGDGDGDNDGMQGIQNAFARWRKVDAVKATVGRQMSGKPGAAEVRVVKRARRSPRMKRIVGACA